MRELIIDGTRIGDDRPAYVIAEIGHNHGGDLTKAKSMVLTAKAMGASAVKFQTRYPDHTYARGTEPGAFDFVSDNPQWMDPVYGRHRWALEFSESEWQELFDYCRNTGITAFSTPFDHRSADMLNRLDVPAFKIASGDATNTPLIRHVAAFGKPMLISTGGCSMGDIYRIEDQIANSSMLHGYRIPYAILQCSCVYPAPSDTLNLRVIETYRKAFPDIVIGLSSHNPNWYGSLAAYALGARIFEHHYTNDRSWKGTDNSFSLTPKSLVEFISALESVRHAMGSPNKQVLDQEHMPAQERRKKLVWTRDLAAGERIGELDIMAKCPGNGMPPYLAGLFTGANLVNDVKAEEDVVWEDVGKSVDDDWDAGE